MVADRARVVLGDSIHGGIAMLRCAPIALLLLASCATAAEDEELDSGPSPTAVVRPMPGTATVQAKPAAAANLVDHGGPVLAASKTVAIYWGTPSAFPADLTTGMNALLAGFTGSSYLGVARQYMRGAAISTSFAGSVSDTSAPPSRSPSTTTIAREVCKLFPNPDRNALYIVFTSNTPRLNFCAWHDGATCNGVPIQVAYMPNQAGLPGCSPFTRTNLGCNTFSNATVTTADSVAHEFMEAITDPQINAWLDGSGSEIGDKCNFVYSSCVNLGANNSWQIQAEWSNAISGCQQQ
jgi:hypothetical protein